MSHSNHYADHSTPALPLHLLDRDGYGAWRAAQPAAAAAWLDAQGFQPAPGSVALLPAEDALALAEQPNLPGTVATHPNWRRRLPQPLPAEPLQQAMVAFADARQGAGSGQLA